MPPLVGDLEDIAVGVVEVDQRDIALAILCGHEHRALAAQPQQRIAVALDVRAQQA
jgi:hypothetical protein